MGPQRGNLFVPDPTLSRTVRIRVRCDYVHQRLPMRKNLTPANFSESLRTMSLLRTKSSSDEPSTANSQMTKEPIVGHLASSSTTTSMTSVNEDTPDPNTAAGDILAPNRNSSGDYSARTVVQLRAFCDKRGINTVQTNKKLKPKGVLVKELLRYDKSSDERENSENILGPASSLVILSASQPAASESSSPSGSTDRDAPSEHQVPTTGNNSPPPSATVDS